MNESNPRRRVVQEKGVYCSCCYLRFGVAERYLIKGDKAYHEQCYSKLHIEKPEVPADS